MAKAKQSKHKLEIPVKLAGDGDGSPEMAAYLYDRQGQVVEHSPIVKNKIALQSDRPLNGLRLAIGPAFSPQQRINPPSLESLKQMNAFFVRPQIDLENIPERLQLPPGFWENWLLKFCTVQGRVVKPYDQEDGTEEIWPVCRARVHICEVDPIRLILPRLPDREIFRLRDELLDISTKSWPPELPEVPDIPVPPGPGPDPVPLFGNKIDPQITAENLFHGPKIVQPKAIKQSQDALLSPDIKFALGSHSATALKQTFLQNPHILRPWLCFWPWLDNWFYRCDELQVVETDDEGKFSTFIWYPQLGDIPDLYFWVEYFIDGEWTTVYRPSIRCNTWWDYKCGTEVVLSVTDPRVEGCKQIPSYDGKQIIVESMGLSVPVDEIYSKIDAGLHGQIGTVKPNVLDYTRGKNAPFGGIIYPRVHFGKGLRASGITHYRWSFRELSEASFTVIDNPVTKYYDGGSEVGLKPVLLSGGLGNEYYVEIPGSPPEGEDWFSRTGKQVIDESSAQWVTPKLGKFILKLELFKDISGTKNLVNLTAENVILRDGFERLAAADRVYPESSSEIMGYNIILHIDNRPCTGRIEPVELSQGSSLTPCGFYEYESNSEVELKFEASHPGGFARFDYTTTRVATRLENASVENGLVEDENIGRFALNEMTGLYKNSFEVNNLLTTECNKAAFAQSLHVRALATDGSSRLSRYDAGDIRAFALTPKET